MSYNFVDLCAGIGGFHQVFKLYGNCLLTCEIDNFCKKTYQENYKSLLWESDITKIIPSNLLDFDILCAGFPCQAFSLAGKQAGFSDTRGTIFFNIQDILREKQPKAFLLENVKNLLAHDKGKTFQIIKNKLDELNYHYYYLTINSQYFVPQKRERIYIFGVHKNVCSNSEFKNLTNLIEERYAEKQKQQLPKISDILEKNVDSKYTLSDKLWKFLQKHAEKHKNKGNGFGYGLIDPKTDITARTLTARYHKDGSEILIKQEGKNPRKLTPRECARLMGFPEDFKITVSNTQAYKQFGNSVVVPVVKMLADEIIKFLNNHK